MSGDILTAALDQCARWTSQSHRNAPRKPDAEIQANVTLAMLRVQGLVAYVADEAIRERLALAQAALEYVHSALDAKNKARQALARRQAQGELIASNEAAA